METEGRMVGIMGLHEAGREMQPSKPLSPAHRAHITFLPSTAPHIFPSEGQLSLRSLGQRLHMPCCRRCLMETSPEPNGNNSQRKDFFIRPNLKACEHPAPPFFVIEPLLSCVIIIAYAVKISIRHIWVPLQNNILVTLHHAF